MSADFKTKDEITLANEFIGYLEQLKSGGDTNGTPGVGTNRALERLAENTNALLEAVQSGKWATLMGGGDISWNAPNVAWTSNFIIWFTAELFPATHNIILIAESPVGLTLGQIAWVVVDRATDAASLTVSKGTIFSFYSAVFTASAKRLDVVPLFFRDSGGLVLLGDGRRIREGESLLGGGFRDTQYGQQTELTQVREQQLDNLKLMLVGGGDISWNISGPNSMAWTGTFQMLFPAQGTGKFELSAGSKTIPPGQVAYLTLDRDAASGPITDASLGVIAIGSLAETDDVFVLAYHNAADSKLYMWDGTSLNDGDVVELGGVRSGVQWFFKGAGTAPAGTPAIPHPGQITDFEAALGTGTTYKVGTGELMVYRNGVKAKASLATWEGGSHPAGGLVGTVEDYDEYLEEDPNTDGTGTRIIWLRDNTPDGAVGHPSDTHDPPWTWPKSLATGDPDFLEAFVGIQGNQRSVANVDGIYGFETVFTEQGGGARVFVAGGVLVTAGDPYHHLNGSNIYADPDTDLVAGDPTPLFAPAWNYLYLKPGAVFGGPPELVFTRIGPDSDALGVHPSQADHRFLSSVYMDTVSAVRGFSKVGGHLTLSRGVDASAAFAGLSNGWNVINLAGHIPDTSPGTVTLRIGVDPTGAVSAGESFGIRLRGLGYTDTGRSLSAIRPSNGSGRIYLEFDVPIMDGKFELDVDIGGEISSVPEAEVLGIFEGRHTAAIELGA